MPKLFLIGDYSVLDPLIQELRIRGITTRFFHDEHGKHYLNTENTLLSVQTTTENRHTNYTLYYNSQALCATDIHYHAIAWFDKTSDFIASKLFPSVALPDVLVTDAPADLDHIMVIGNQPLDSIMIALLKKLELNSDQEYHEGQWIIRIPQTSPFYLSTNKKRIRYKGEEIFNFELHSRHPNVYSNVKIFFPKIEKLFYRYIAQYTPMHWQYKCAASNKIISYCKGTFEALIFLLNNQFQINSFHFFPYYAGYKHANPSLEQCQQLLAALKGNTSLIELNFPSCTIPYEFFISLLEIARNIPSFTTLKFSMVYVKTSKYNTQFNTEHVEKLVTALQGNSSLVTFEFPSCTISSSDFMKILLALNQIPSLKTLSLDRVTIETDKQFNADEMLQILQQLHFDISAWSNNVSQIDINMAEVLTKYALNSIKNDKTNLLNVLPLDIVKMVRCYLFHKPKPQPPLSESGQFLPRP